MSARPLLEADVATRMKKCEDEEVRLARDNERVRGMDREVAEVRAQIASEREAARRDREAAKEEQSRTKEEAVKLDAKKREAETFDTDTRRKAEQELQRANQAGIFS